MIIKNMEDHGIKDLIEVERIGKITFYDDSQYFYIGHSDDPDIYRISREEEILKVLKTDMKKYGPLRYWKNAACLTFGRKKGGIKATRLSAYLYARYQHISLKKIRKRIIAEKDRSGHGVRNFTRDNLFLVGTGSDANNRTRTIEVVNDRIIYTLKVDGVATHATYHEVLYQIALQNKFSPWHNADGRLVLRESTPHGSCEWYFYDIAFACYYGFVTSPDDMICQMEKFRKYKNDRNLEVDHADSNVRNCTKRNLSLMTAGLNARKRDIVTKFVQPFYLNAIYCDGKYRIYFKAWSPQNEQLDALLQQLFTAGVPMFRYQGVYSQMQWICATDEEFVDCLYGLAEGQHTWAGRGDMTVKENRKKDPSACYWAGDIEHSCRDQEALEQLPQDAFNIWPAKN